MGGGPKAAPVTFYTRLEIRAGWSEMSCNFLPDVFHRAGQIEREMDKKL